MIINPGIVTTVASVFSSLVVIFGAIFSIYRFVTHQSEQDREITKMKEEQQVVCYGVLACLRGLREQGCDGPVNDAINTLEKHLNEQAHN